MSVPKRKSMNVSKRKYCNWIHNDSDDSYDSDCGEKWQFLAGTCKENGVVYCHKCGKLVKCKTG